MNDFHRIDLLINCAGTVSGKFIVDLTYEDISKTMDVNLTGLIWITKKILTSMVEKNSGHIVNIASAAGILAVPGLADYSASKSGVIAFSDMLVALRIGDGGFDVMQQKDVVCVMLQYQV